MSVADLHDLELIWPSLKPTDVIVTGTFDQWSSSIRLAKGDAGFFGIVKVPWGQKVVYKFIVDGLWRCRDDRPQEDDGHGNINNVLRTPEKPAAHDPPARLSIPLDGPQSEGYGDVEAMVTAVEYLPPAEPTTTRGSLPLPIPQIIVQGLSQAPSVGTAVSEPKLDTAAATEGHVSASDTPATINDNGPVSLPPVNGSGGPPSVHGTAEEALFAPLGSAVPQPIHSSQVVQDAPVITDPVDVPPTPTPAATLEPTVKQSGVDHEAAALGHRRNAAAPISIGRASTSSTPVSSTLTHKKRRSFFARIKHIFDKDKDRQEKKENKH